MRNVLLQWLFTSGRPRFQGAQRDHVRVQSSSCCFPRASLSFVRPRVSLGFDQWHVTRSPPIRKRIWVGRYNKDKYPSIFSPQMEAIVFIILQTFFATRAVLKIGEYSRIFPSFSWGIFGHETRLDQSRASEKIWCIIKPCAWVDFGILYIGTGRRNQEWKCEVM